MSMFDWDDRKDTPRPNAIPTVRDYQTARVDSEDKNLRTLMTHIAGRRWILTAYYSQVLGRDEEPSAFQPGLLPINRQTKKILNLEFKVTQPAPQSPTFEITSKEAIARGQATAYPHSVIPQEGDAFIADAGDGRLGLFQVTGQVLPKSIYNATAYEFEFVMHSWLSRDTESKLDQGVVEIYHFIRDNLDTGVNPIVTHRDYETYERLWERKARMPFEYTQKFYSREYSTYMLPGQSNWVYDPFHANFCNILFGNIHEGPWNMTASITVETGQNNIVKTVHDCIYDLNVRLLPMVASKIPIVSTKNFGSEPLFGGIRWVGIPWVVYPSDKKDIHGQWSGITSAGGIKLVQTPRMSLNAPLTFSEAFSEEDLGIPILDPFTLARTPYKPVTFDDYYILSQAFYSRNFAGMSRVEYLLYRYIETESTDPLELLDLIDKSERWSMLDQFYLQPLLYAMIPGGYRGV